MWTTFNSWQWDLDWSNPAVFTEMLDVVLALAARGVDVFRLDAAPFLWKRMGTSCQNEPEAHLILQALRALVRTAAPGVILKAEAIVPPEELVKRFPGSLARGALFQENPATGDARISGSAASLCGLEAALEDGNDGAVDAALRRLVLLHSVVFSYGGIPLVWMGDELALRNDRDWADDPASDGDNRWMHRPCMDWAAAARRDDPDTLEGRVHGALRGLAAARRAHLALRAGGETTPLPVDDPRVFAYRRRHQRSEPLLALVNFGDTEASVGGGVLAAARLFDPVVAHTSDPSAPPPLRDGRVVVPALGFVWFVER